MNDTLFLTCPYCNAKTGMTNPQVMDYAMQYTQCHRCGHLVKFEGGLMVKCETPIHFGYSPDRARWSPFRYPVMDEPPKPEPEPAPASITSDTQLAQIRAQFLHLEQRVNERSIKQKPLTEYY